MTTGARFAGSAFLCAAAVAMASSQVRQPETAFRPAIPKTWDERALEELEVPLAQASHSPKDIPVDAYYRIPVRPIYKSYPNYQVDKEPPGYRERLASNEPIVLWDDGPHRPVLVTEADWIEAGELVFKAPLLFSVANETPEERRAFDAKTGDNYDKDGVSPFATIVVRERGKIEIGEASCAECHSRIMPDGSVIAGAQGNRPIEQVVSTALASEAEKAADKDAFLNGVRLGERGTFAAPWLRPDPHARLEQFSAAEIAAVHFAIPPGVFARQGTSPFSPAKMPDLIGIKERRYLDATGLVRHRSIGDLMRYAALNQGMDMVARYGDFIPAGTSDPRQAASVFAQFAQARYSDEQLYALALYIYSLQPPPNPNPPSPLTARGEQVFQRERCVACHPPPLFTNNRLTPADGFRVPDDHRTRFEIMPRSVGTDPTLTLTTRRGTGYYKVPSLKGVWYRGPFEHNGSVATLEDWFDPRRLRDDYVPTGWKGNGVRTRAVKGHEFGLTLSRDDRQALIAYLKTL